MVGRKIRNMEEFAAVSGISRPTVSKYFNDPSSVRASTRERIEAALETHSYQPNVYAVNQNRKLTKNIGIVVPFLADPFFAEIARNIERRCIDAGFWPMLFSAHGDKDLEVRILDSLRAHKPAGVLLAPLGRRSHRAAVEAFCQDVPTVLFDSQMQGLGEAFIGSDNEQVVGCMVEYLIRTGQPPCFFEMKTPVNPNANKRSKAYVAAMQRHGHEPMLIQVSGETWAFEEIGYLEGKRVLADGSVATNTMLCSNDRLAIGLLAAAYERGLRVGAGPGCAIRIAGLDDHPFSRYTSPPLTTVAQDYDAIAERSVETLFELIDSDGASSNSGTVLFKGNLVMRMSA